MGRRATCFDNAVAESFFATYKKELIQTRPWGDLTEVQQYTFLWIEGYYNRRRRHSTLKYLTPLEYELGYRKLTNWRSKPVSIKSGTLHGGIQADGEAPAPRQGTCLTPPYRTRPGPGLRRGRRPREGSPGPARPNPVGFSNPERGCPLTASGSSSSDAAQCR
jgi:hypothetical protein